MVGISSEKQDCSVEGEAMVRMCEVMQTGIELGLGL
jgi:hypothetical protein